MHYKLVLPPQNLGQKFGSRKYGWGCKSRIEFMAMNDLSPGVSIFFSILRISKNSFSGRYLNSILFRCVCEGRRGGREQKWEERGVEFFVSSQTVEDELAFN